MDRFVDLAKENLRKEIGPRGPETLSASSGSWVALKRHFRFMTDYWASAARQPEEAATIHKPPFRECGRAPLPSLPRNNSLMTSRACRRWCSQSNTPLIRDSGPFHHYWWLFNSLAKRGAEASVTAYDLASAVKSSIASTCWPKRWRCRQTQRCKTENFRQCTWRPGTPTWWAKILSEEETKYSLSGVESSPGCSTVHHRSAQHDISCRFS